MINTVELIHYLFLQDVNVSACSSGRGQLVVGDFEGNIYFINRQLTLSSFRAYDIRVTHMHQMKQHNILVTIGVSSLKYFTFNIGHFIFSVISHCRRAFF